MTPGIKTTEFLALLLLGAVIVLNGTRYVSIDTATLNTFIAAVVAYIGQRGWVKTAAAKTQPKE